MLYIVAVSGDLSYRLASGCDRKSLEYAILKEDRKLALPSQYRSYIGRHARKSTCPFLLLLQSSTHLEEEFDEESVQRPV